MDVKNFRTDRKDWLRDEIFAMSRKQWQVVKWLLKSRSGITSITWISASTVCARFLELFRQKARPVPAGQSLRECDSGLLSLAGWTGSVMEMLDEETILLVASDHARNASTAASRSMSG